MKGPPSIWGTVEFQKEERLNCKTSPKDISGFLFKDIWTWKH